MIRSAVFDPTCAYRYRLTRVWDRGPRVAFILLNPSTANAHVDDPTIRRCIGFARSWGYSGVEVVNLFAYRTPSPSALRSVADPIGPDNDTHILAVAAEAEAIVLSWGNHGAYLSRAQAVLPLLSACGNLYTFGLTASGQPRHPLYLPASQPRLAFTPQLALS